MPAKETKFARANRLWHERARAEDARRLAAREVTPEQLQRENSFLPANVKIDAKSHMVEYIKRYYSY
ncbi:MAG: hypothetical protein LBK76_06055 [Verrucomicrobiales bacterium]|jgi:hypothetical protein|nr:hypothetical protein [Verrucomicrobiales bacterium]